MDRKICQQCSKKFFRKLRRNSKWWITAKFCSQSCYSKSRIGKPSGMLGKVSWNKGLKTGLIPRSAFKKGFTPWNFGLIGKYSLVRSEKGKKSYLEKMSGPNNPNWISDRTNLRKSEKKHLDGRYRDWMFAVKNRDNWKCKMNNEDCLGRLEAHHILDWINYLELRYELNNGITLCHAHHPKGRTEEKVLSSYFQNLVSVLGV